MTVKDCQATYFAQIYKTWLELVSSRRFTGGRIPSKLAFYKAKKNLKIKKSVTKTE